ncbi:nicotinate-nucleotide--dimethylbenzimidazole phosphoribosyltransferase, partial [Kineococcus sp. SYSU DK001]|uniref:nicotinate-nucleotide--dimethylbenzimidazole phosphoribosyltransferase n=1 Tax=Kineococcus sp. SYSU DK001 TaxID=3383122 RepID=UPI003D7E29DA
MTDGPRPLNLREIAEGLRSPHTPAARPRRVAPLLPASRADQLARWLAGTQDRDVPRPVDRARLVVFAGDHGVAARGISRLEPGWGGGGGAGRGGGGAAAPRGGVVAVGRGVPRGAAGGAVGLVRPGAGPAGPAAG